MMLKKLLLTFILAITTFTASAGVSVSVYRDCDCGLNPYYCISWTESDFEPAFPYYVWGDHLPYNYQDYSTNANGCMAVSSPKNKWYIAGSSHTHPDNPPLRDSGTVWMGDADDYGEECNTSWRVGENRYGQALDELAYLATVAVDENVNVDIGDAVNRAFLAIDAYHVYNFSRSRVDKLIASATRAGNAYWQSKAFPFFGEQPLKVERPDSLPENFAVEGPRKK